MRPGRCHQIPQRFFSIPLIAVLLLLASGCSQLKVKLGTRVRLDQVAVASMQVSIPKGPAIAPGQKMPLVVQFTKPDGTILLTEGQGHGKILWSDLTVTPTIVTADQKGIITLPSDPRLSDGKIAHVAISVPTHPDLHAALDIPITYDYKFAANFSGNSGSNGSDGTNGFDGTPGTPGSLDPNNPSPGGNGGDGTNGSSGQNGTPGSDAPSVSVRVAVRLGPQPLLQPQLQISIVAGGNQRFYLVDPKGGSLTITANGGSGGFGGKGGRGGRGGPGGIGTPNGSSGHDGLNGQDGFTGSSGRPGHITVTYDPEAKPFLSALHLINKGGPAPSFNEQPVPPIW